MFIKVEQDPLENHQTMIQYWHATTNSASDCPPRLENCCHLDYLGATEGKKCASLQQQGHSATGHHAKNRGGEQEHDYGGCQTSGKAHDLIIACFYLLSFELPTHQVRLHIALLKGQSPLKTISSPATTI
jgi:hypothetical protein